MIYVLVNWKKRLKKISDVVRKEAAKNTKFNKLITKVNNLENKIPAALTRQTNTTQKNKMLIKKYLKLVL